MNLFILPPSPRRVAMLGVVSGRSSRSEPLHVICPCTHFAQQPGSPPNLPWSLCRGDRGSTLGGSWIVPCLPPPYSANKQKEMSVYLTKCSRFTDISISRRSFKPQLFLPCGKWSQQQHLINKQHQSLDHK